MKRSMVLDILIPCLILAVSTALLAATNADLRIEGLFYEQGSGWVYANDNPWQLLFQYGELPGVFLGAGALIVYTAGFFSEGLFRFRRSALFLVLLVALGPGLLTTGLKDTWGRPRPRQVVSLGGEQDYRPVWRVGTPGQGNSFPSGHAAIAFYLLAPYFVLRRKSGARALVFLALGLVYGTAMGLARMVQGGHFPSDVLWSAGFVYLTGAVLYHAYLAKEITGTAEGGGG